MNIKEFIKSLDIQVFVEIGAHFGTDTLEFRKLHPNARIVSFEPDPRNSKMIKHLGIDKECELIEKAVGNETKKIPFFLSSGNAKKKEVSQILKDNDWSCSSSLKKPTGHLYTHPWIQFNRSIQVDCIRLDDVSTLKGCTIDFLWMDVQGAEELVFQGGQDTLKRVRYLYTEYCNQQLYEGQLNLSQLLSILGTSWKVIYDYGGDILLQNITLETPPSL
jgi:FkbM family methyltransferase